MDIPNKVKLTNRLCRELPFSTTGQYVMRDAAMPGFLCVVGARSRTYTLQLDVMVLGKRKTVKRAIGSVEDFDASAARLEAQRMTVEIRTEKTKHVGKRNAPTFDTAWADYRKRLEARIAVGERSPRSLEARIDHVERLLADWLDVPLRQLGDAPHLIAERHREITLKYGPIQANRVMETFRAIYAHVLKRRLDPGLPPVSPTSAVDFNREERRSTGMSPQELRTWAKQLDKLPNQVRREFHLFTLLSAMRPDALTRARWEHLDMEKRVLHVPDPKGGKRRAFDLPLSRAMLRCLWRTRRVGRLLHSDAAHLWIYPAATPTGHIAEHRERRTVLSHWGSDLRQTWRTAAQAAGLSELDCSLIMNHSLGSVNAGYITSAALRDHLRACQEKVSRHVMAMLKL